eukprot:403346269
MYYRYWFYTKQGLRTTGFPMPLIGTLPKFAKIIQRCGEWEDTPFVEYQKECFPKEVPPVYVDFRNYQSSVIVNDPDILHEIFKQSYPNVIDKTPRVFDLFYGLTGNSFNFQLSKPEILERRKYLMGAFHKSRMEGMLKKIVETAVTKVKQQRDIIKSSKIIVQLELCDFLNNLVHQCVEVCVFGISDENSSLKFVQEQRHEMISMGQFIKKVMTGIFTRSVAPIRQFTSIFDRRFLGKNEKEIEQNCITFRNYIRDIVNKRRVDLRNPNFKSDDFLTMILTDDFMKNDIELIIDESIVFMLGSIQNVATALANSLFFVTQKKEVNDKIRKEIRETFGQSDPEIITINQWQEQLNYEDLMLKWQYVSMVCTEAMRIEAPTKLSIPYQFNQATNIRDIKYDKYQQFHFNIHSLHLNPKEWREPEQFIPERFDPESPYYLTPEGKRRKPTSYLPFGGGKRMCMGKTLAENLNKTILPIVVAYLDFQFVRPEFYERKPPLELAINKQYDVIVSANEKI